MKHHGSFSGVSLGLLALIYTIAGYGIFAGISLIAFAFRIKSVGGEIGNHHSPRDARKRQTRMSVTLGLLSCIATIVIVSICGTASRADDTDEAQLGAQLFNELKSRGEIVQSSPLYDTLAPIAAGITKVVRRQYAYPIHFYIVHEVQPNAFAAPGGNVYVVDSLFYFVKNTEELAGTLCHETSHLLHHDSLKLMKRNETIRRRAVGATILLGPTIGTALAVGAIARLDTNHYSRDAEEAADLTGSDTCAAAGYNPWGLVWLFQDFSNADIESPPEILSDHPNNAHRVARLEAHFKRNHATFTQFDADKNSATHLVVSADEAERFLR
jgi:predicted Zn-dependent protease